MSLVGADQSIFNHIPRPPNGPGESQSFLNSLNSEWDCWHHFGMGADVAGTIHMSSETTDSIHALALRPVASVLTRSGQVGVETTRAITTATELEPLETMRPRIRPVSRNVRLCQFAPDTPCRRPKIVWD